MKASIGRLRRLTSHKVDSKVKGELVATAQIDELDRAGKDMQDMRDCYDRLLAAAAATANSAYEFSESLGEMGSCLEQIAPHTDKESSSTLFMLVKVQFELQSLLDTYRTHIFKTITIPSESLLKDLRTVEDMKQQCDEKRNVFEMSLVKDKGKPKSSKKERYIPSQSRPAYNEFHDEATMCIFRLKSLKEGQARSLLTQAVRHHTAQMRLFNAGLKSLEAVEQHVRVAAEKQHIDCDLSVHANEVEASEDNDDDDGQYINGEGELSFAYRVNEQRVDPASLSTPWDAVKMDDTDLSFPRPSAVTRVAVNADHRDGYPVLTRDRRMSSHSAPLFPDKKSDLSERLRQVNPSTNAYILPTPVDSRYTKPAAQALFPRPANHSAENIWHSSPLEPIKSGKDAENNSLYVRLPRPSTTDTHHHQQQQQQQQQAAPRHAFSGPLKPSSTKPDISSGAFCPLPVPPVVQVHPHSSSSPRVSPSASPPPASSSPRLNELHQLPRPPGHFAPPPRRAKSPGLVGHSAPLTGWNQERNSVTVAPPSTSSIVASPLPVPPLVVSRSFSIPSRNQRAFPQRLVERNEDRVASPPLTPMTLSRPIHQATGVAQTSQIRGY